MRRNGDVTGHIMDLAQIHQKESLVSKEQPQLAVFDEIMEDYKGDNPRKLAFRNLEEALTNLSDKDRLKVLTVFRLGRERAICYDCAQKDVRFQAGHPDFVRYMVSRGSSLYTNLAAGRAKFGDLSAFDACPTCEGDKAREYELECERRQLEWEERGFEDQENDD